MTSEKLPKEKEKKNIFLASSPQNIYIYIYIYLMLKNKCKNNNMLQGKEPHYSPSM
jgi:hypothetical protein